MEPGEKVASVPLPGEVRFTIPKALLDAFAQEPRILIKWRPDGLWPIPPELLRETFDRIVNDKEILENYDVVLMKKGTL